MVWRAGLALLLAAAALFAEEPLSRVSADVRKAIRKAVDGNEKAQALIEKIGPLAHQACEEIEKKNLRGWPFKSVKSGRITFKVQGREREYALSVPRGYSKKRSWPLILSLHGAGGNGPMELSFMWSGDQKRWKGFIAAPSGDPPGAQWFPEQEEFVLGVLRDVGRRANIDANRIYCQGFSNGGNGAWYYAMHHPSLFGAMCTRGGGNPSPGLLVNLKRVPTFIVHGENDTVIKVGSDRRAAAELEKLGFEHVYKEVKGGGHKPFTNFNPDILKYFSKHPREPWPKELAFRVPGRDRFRYLWLEVSGGAGSVEARVDGNVIEIDGARKAVLWLSDALVDLDAEIVVHLDGEEAFKGRVERRLAHLVADLKARFDRHAPAWVRLEVG
ncbi:MAG: carboxylesterase family protein [Planctomycetota bacterium]|jgi:predicted esterase